MYQKLFLVMMFSVILFSSSIPISFAQIDDFIDIVDKETFVDDSCISITGKVKTIFPDIPVIIRVFAPNGNLIELRQLDVDEDLQFNAKFVPKGSLWKYDGGYTMKITYAKHVLEDLVYMINHPIYAPSIPIDAYFDNKGYYFDQYFWNPTNILWEDDSNSISYELYQKGTPCTNESYSHSIYFYNLLTNHDDDNQQNEFSVFVNGNQTTYDMTTYGENANKITFLIPYGTAQIEVTATKVVPEFGIIAILVFGISIFTTIMIFRMSSLRYRIR